MVTKPLPALGGDIHHANLVAGIAALTGLMVCSGRLLGELRAPLGPFPSPLHRVMERNGGPGGAAQRFQLSPGWCHKMKPPFFFSFFKNQFIYFCLCWVFLAA